MRFYVKPQELTSQKADCLVVGVYSDQKLSRAAKKADRLSQGLIKNVLKLNDFAGKLGSSAMLLHPAGLPCSHLLLVGLGDSNKLSAEDFQALARSTFAEISQHTVKQVNIDLNEMKVADHDWNWQMREWVIQAGHSFYRFDRYKTLGTSKAQGKDKDTAPNKITFACPNNKQTGSQQAIKAGQAIAAGMALYKDLGHEPGNVCTPTYLAKTAKQIASRDPKLSCSILNQAALEKENMGALLAVSQGSAQAPKLIVLNYRGGKRGDAPLVFVGKGVSFDTGGISLKPRANMQHMKTDMCGAATVLALLQVASALKLPLNIIGVVPSVENMPSSTAYKPGDIIKSAAGYTIEITNTDAEGRMILCDALHYCKRFKPAAVIDIATLTGACIMALGHEYSAFYTEDAELAQALKSASEHSADRAWHMPMHRNYQKLLDSKYADFVNGASSGPGSITAAMFLAHFTSDYRWAHFDIAGSSYTAAKGCTGRPVPLLVDFLLAQ